MTKVEIAEKINPQYPDVYAPTVAPTELLFDDGTIKIGFFQHTEESSQLEIDNKYTFVEFGENAQKYRATLDSKYTTIVDGNKIIDVIYPAKSPVLSERIKRLKHEYESKTDEFWTKYKQEWITAVKTLLNQIVFKWLKEFEDKKLIDTSIIPLRRTDPYIGEYYIVKLEIALRTGHFIIIEPISALTSEYDGRVDLYVSGDLSKRIAILRKLMENNNYAWVIAESNKLYDQRPLKEVDIKNIISTWGQL